MWSWVEQLKEPVITKEDVDMLVDRQADTAEALFLLEKGQYQTILCVLHCIVSLQTLPMEVEEACLLHAIKAFTKVSPCVLHTSHSTSVSQGSREQLLFSSKTFSSFLKCNCVL